MASSARTAGNPCTDESDRAPSVVPFVRRGTSFGSLRGDVRLVISPATHHGLALIRAGLRAATIDKHRPMSATIRLATKSDAPAWLDLLQNTLGPGYPGREVYDPGWIAAELTPELDRQTWLAERDGQLQASLSFLKPSDINNNPVANLGRCLFRPQSHTSGAAAALLQKVKELAAERGQMAVSRVPVTDLPQQRLFEESGFGCVGFQPCKHMVAGRHGILFYVHFTRPALVNRLPVSESLPQVCTLGNAVLSSLNLPGLVTLADGATGYPLQVEMRIEEITCDNLAVWRRHTLSEHLPTELSHGYNLGLGWLRLPGSEPPSGLLASRGDGPSAGLAFLFDPHDRCVRITEAFSTDDLCLGALVAHVIKLAQDRFQAAYVEMDVLMTAPRLLRSAEQLGFVPVAYLPAFVFHNAAFADVVKLVKLNVACDLEPAELAPKAAAMITVTKPFFEDQKLGVAVTNLLRGLSMFEGLGDGELRKVSRLFDQKLYRAGETIFHQGDSGTEAYIVMRGQVEIMLDQPSQSIASVLSGQVFGEQAFLEGIPRSAAAVASQPSIVLVVRRQAFAELTQREPHLGMVVFRNIALDLSAKLRKASAALSARKQG